MTPLPQIQAQGEMAVDTSEFMNVAEESASSETTQEFDRVVATQELLDGASEDGYQLHMVQRIVSDKYNHHPADVRRSVRWTPIAVDEWHPEGIPMASWLEEIIRLSDTDATCVDASTITFLAIKSMPRRQDG